MRRFVAAVAASVLCACTPGPAEEIDNEEESAVERRGETYQEFDERRNSYSGSRGTFGDDGCTVDCGGHEAGYSWAEENEIADPDDCGGKSWSFEEGCRTYAEEQAEVDEVDEAGEF